MFDSTAIQNKCSAVAEMGDRLATTDMGQKRGGELGPRLTKCSLAEAYLHIKWHLDPSSHLAITDIGQNLADCALWGKLGPHLTQCCLGQGLPPYQVAS